jgi:mRNA interferase MazF
MASIRTTFTLDDDLAERARRLGINISAAAREGVASAVRVALAQSDRAAYVRHPERPDSFWTEAEAWGHEIWIAQVGRKRRPVLVLTRTEVLDVRDLVTIAEVTTSIRGLAAEVGMDHHEVGLDQPSVVNCDGLHTVAQSSLTACVGELSDDTVRKVCSAITYALGC